MSVQQCPNPGCNQFLDRNGACRNCRGTNVVEARRAVPAYTTTVHPGSLADPRDRVQRAASVVADAEIAGYNPATRHITVPSEYRVTTPTNPVYDELSGVVQALQMRSGGAGSSDDRVRAATSLAAACDALRDHFASLEHDLAYRMMNTADGVKNVDWVSGRVIVDWGLRRKSWDHDGIADALTDAFAEQTGYAPRDVRTVINGIRRFGTPSRYRTGELALLNIDPDEFSTKAYRDEPGLRVETAQPAAPLDAPVPQAADAAASWLRSLTADMPAIRHHLTRLPLPEAAQEYAAIRERFVQIRSSASQFTTDVADELHATGTTSGTASDGTTWTVSQGRATLKWDHESVRDVIVTALATETDLPRRQVAWISDCYWRVAAMDSYKQRALTAAGADISELAVKHSPAPRLAAGTAASQPVPAG